MQDFKKRHRTAGILLRFGGVLLGVLLLLFLAGFAIRAAWGMYGTFRVAAEARESALRELESLEEDEARVAAAVAALNSPQGVEKEVRERYGVAKPGEGEIHIVRDEALEDTAASQNDSFLQKLFRSLFAW